LNISDALFSYNSRTERHFSFTFFANDYLYPMEKLLGNNL